jgi:copper chaperone
VVRKKELAMVETMIYNVPGMTCDHCKQAVTSEVAGVAGVVGVEVDLATKVVTVNGNHLDDRTLRAAIEEAGYQATP